MREGRNQAGQFVSGHKKVGQYMPTARSKGQEHHAWKGDQASYAAKHMWVRDHYGKADHCEFDPTHSGRFEWSNISGRYLRERSDWRQLCASCHRLLDIGDICKRGHALTPDNTYIYKGTRHRKCRTCHRENQQTSARARREVINVG